LENNKGIHISGVGGDVFGLDVSGSGNVIGKNISVSGTINVNNEQLLKIPDEYAKALKDFSTSINEQITNHNIYQSQVAPLQESINELAKETEGIKPDQEVVVVKKTELKTKFVNVAKNVLKVLPKTAETVAAFTPLAPFSKLIGEATQSVIEAIQKEV
jgi:ABC-type multidrug transport system fused ATPase/permease subunit